VRLDRVVMVSPGFDEHLRPFESDAHQTAQSDSLSTSRSRSTRVFGTVTQRQRASGAMDQYFVAMLGDIDRYQGSVGRCRLLDGHVRSASKADE
jgi:hypothetical protein